MGVERAVTRWYINHQRLTDEIAALEAKLVQMQAGRQASSNTTDIENQLASLHDKLRTLGPCPKPMMG